MERKQAEIFPRGGGWDKSLGVSDRSQVVAVGIS
jgi:hypothetical protein